MGVYFRFNMIVAKFPSKIFLPETERPYPSIINFLIKRFPLIPEQTWIERINRGLIFFKNGKKIQKDSLYTPLSTILYYKTADKEPFVPFDEKIIYRDEHIIAVNKPSFLPVMPAGKYINENLLTRLKKKTGNQDIVPVNRIDRETSGIVLFSVNKKTRGIYQSLFMYQKVKKTYYAITESDFCLPCKDFLIQSRIVKGKPWFTMKSIKGEINARTIVRPVKKKDKRTLFCVTPLTGKKHQIRIHLSSIGCKIINDRIYPDLLPENTIDFQHPLQLQSKSLEFVDPLTDKIFEFISRDHLDL